MPYRNITVDGQDYRYIVGPKFVKITRVGAAPNGEVGMARTIPEYCCEDHCMIVGEQDKFSVQPSDIARWIRSKKD